MINLKTIIIKNHDTFYDYNNGDKVPQIKRYFFQLLFAIILTLLFGKIKLDLLNSILTIYSILIGFSFSILFYLLSTNKEEFGEPSESLSEKLKDVNTPIVLEDLEKTDKLKNLTKELFYNVSYFNLVSVFIILIALSFIIIQNQSLIETTFMTCFMKNYDLYQTIEKSSYFIKYSFILTFYSLLVESLYSFIRIISRVNFLFNEVINET